MTKQIKRQKDAEHDDIQWRGMLIKPWYRSPRKVDFQFASIGCSGNTVRISVEAEFAKGVAIYYKASIQVGCCISKGAGATAEIALNEANHYLQGAASDLS